MKKIITTKGLMDEALLDKKNFAIDNDVEETAITEYWLGGTPGVCQHPRSNWLKKPRAGSDDYFECGDCGAEQVHRSITMRLKKAAAFAEAIAAELK